MKGIIYYPAFVEINKDGYYFMSFFCKSWFGVTDGKTVQKAYENAIAMLSDYFGCLNEENEDIPIPPKRKKGCIMVPYVLKYKRELESLQRRGYQPIRIVPPTEDIKREDV